MFLEHDLKFTTLKMFYFRSLQKTKFFKDINSAHFEEGYSNGAYLITNKIICLRIDRK